MLQIGLLCVLKRTNELESLYNRPAPVTSQLFDRPVLSGAERTGPPGGGPARDARHGCGPAAGGPWRTKTKTGAANPPDRGDEVPADK